MHNSFMRIKNITVAWNIYKYNYTYLEQLQHPLVSHPASAISTIIAPIMSVTNKTATNDFELIFLVK